MTESTGKPLTLAICGGGSGAHALAGIASSHSSTQVRVLTLFCDEAERWSKALQDGDFTVTRFYQREISDVIKAKPHLVTNDPGKAIPGCDVIVFVMPALAHEQYLRALKPYMEPRMILVGLPGQAGFEFQVRSILGALANGITLINYESLPWAARLKEFGRSCDILGTKSTMMGALRIGSATTKHDPYTVVQRLIGEKPLLTTAGHLLTSTLMSLNAYVHSSVLYDKWADWDGKPLDEKPLFYHAISEKGAALLTCLSDEVVSIAKAIEKQSPGTDLSRMEHVFDWYKRCYINEAGDATSLYSLMRSNKAYTGLCHPVTQTSNGKWVLDCSSRYMTEDIPFGLVVIRGIAEILGVATPHMDKVLMWAQGQLGKKYLVDGKINGEDVQETRAPQRYGFTTLQDLLSV